jgi:hypothetical protein
MNEGRPGGRSRALALQGFQRHAGLEPRVMVPALPHVLISSFGETSRRQIIASVTVRFSGSSSGLMPNTRTLPILHVHRQADDPVVLKKETDWKRNSEFADGPHQTFIF